jgi:hypothetical protein
VHRVHVHLEGGRVDGGKWNDLLVVVVQAVNASQSEVFGSGADDIFVDLEADLLQTNKDR